MTTPIGSQNGIRPGANSPFVTHLECSKTGEPYAKDTLHGMSRAVNITSAIRIITGSSHFFFIISILYYKLNHLPSMLIR